MQSMVVKLTVGADEAETVSQAFSVASAGISAGATVSVWLSGDAVWLAAPGRAEHVQVEYGPSVAQARDLILTSATLTVCGPCAKRRELATEDMLPGVRLAGATSFVAESLTPNTQTLVY